MKIEELKLKQGNVNIEGEVTEIGAVREFSKFGKIGKVCNAKIKDDSGEIQLTLWNDQIEKVKTGDKIRIANGYVSERQGEKQLMTGKFGTLDILN